MSAVIQKALIITLLPSPTKTWGWGGGRGGERPGGATRVKAQGENKIGPFGMFDTLGLCKSRAGCSWAECGLGGQE